MKLRKLIAIALLIVMCGALFVGCGGKDQETGGSAEVDDKPQYKIGVVIKTLGNPHFKAMALGAEKAGKDYGVEIIPAATQQEGQIAEQIQLIEDMISRGVDAVLVSPQTAIGMASAVKTARDAGVVFVTMDTAIEDESVPISIGLDDVEAGYNVGKVVAEKIGGKGKVFLIQGLAGDASSIGRTEGVEKALAEYPGIEIVARQHADFMQDKAQEVVSDLLQAHKEVDAVICLNDLMALGAITALEEMGYKASPNDIIVTGFDGVLPALDSIKEGKMYLTEFLWEEYYGYLGVQACLKILNGEPVPERIKTPSSEITAENVDYVYDLAKEIAEYGW